MSGASTMWSLHFSRQARKDTRKLSAIGLRDKAEHLLSIIADDPFRIPPPFEKLVGDLSGTYSRRINIQHRLVYAVEPDNQAVRVLRLWSHYE